MFSNRHGILSNGQRLWSKSQGLLGDTKHRLTGGRGGYFARWRRQAREDTAAARGLGWASIAIGLAEVLAPGQVAEMLGLEDRPDRRGILRVLGVRELMHGVGILTEHEPSPQLACGVTARVAGDLLDSALLAAAATQTRRPANFALVAASVMAIGAMDAVYAARLNQYR